MLFTFAKVEHEEEPFLQVNWIHDIYRVLYGRNQKNVYNRDKMNTNWLSVGVH